jgi:hypothetical protein
MCFLSSHCRAHFVHCDTLVCPASRRHNEPITRGVAYVAASPCIANLGSLPIFMRYKGLPPPSLQCGRRLLTVWPPSSYSVAAVFSQCLLFTVWSPPAQRPPHTRTSHPTESTMPRLKQELDLAVRIILATPNDEFSVRTLQCLREKFGTTPSRKKPRKINTQILTSLSMETGNEFVKAVYEARKGADEQVRSLWARVEKHLITWEIAGNPNASSRNMSARQRSYRSMSGFDIADLDQKGRDFLMLLAYARVDPMPRETFNGLQESFSWVLSSCKEARELLHEYLIKDKFLKRVYSATARKLPIRALVVYDADYGKRSLNIIIHPIN